MRRARLALSAPILAACTACAQLPAPHVEPTRERWAETRAELADFRRAMHAGPYVAEVSITMREPHSGRVVDGRGAVAVDRARGVRMILVGPGGGTALDAWVTRDRFRFAVPAIGLVRRGASSTSADARGLPIGFFRWWFLAPLDGQLLTAGDDPPRRTWVLRDGAAVSELGVAPSGGALTFHAARAEAGRTERLEWRGRSLAPSQGDGGRYVDAASGFSIDITVDRVGGEPPPPEAFDDPEASP